MVAPFPPVPSAHRWFPAALGLVAAVGLLGTLLPMWSITVHSSALRRGRPVGLDGSDAPTDHTVGIDIGFYDWGVSGRPVGAVLPLALALAIAVAVAAWVSVPDRVVWGVSALAAVCALIVVGGTAVRPTSRQEVTGPVVTRMSPSELADIHDPAPMDVDVGAGLMLALLSVLIVGGLAAWQYAAAIRSSP